jgi:hypothetical protein
LRAAHEEYPEISGKFVFLAAMVLTANDKSIGTPTVGSSYKYGNRAWGFWIWKLLV